ncbi:4-(cytidine 5'-diphospho)-2-C-methyl-D-erythritol kinase [Pontibaca salina]|uniref:4-diphosphocytidyl-2-C-methyl-D-erythritol kinase n=1 Tax=Pontibaca salina TaxID=2795731 RepID=A0A934HK24_9RHOB|nr:4-(cytidine 5'-diphospho)-2-C-methyl-D-erythritol kinase [Pontibaca salina]MBI6629568.1 4-(cytidine 5'-diphospho)-2-C-methyl-D-erythritol kinase [Pontibaca salina]
MKTVEISAFAPAKINLTLHVTGRRADGYHLLDSLVVFADIGDELRLRPARGLTLQVSGPMADGVPRDDRNLALRAARAAGVLDVAISLKKHLPAAAGIGGGSSDAAAVLRALKEGWGVSVGDVAALGADLPVCMAARTTRMSGVGEIVTQVNGIPPLPAVLVNPGTAIPTPAVFAALQEQDGTPMDAIPAFADAESCACWLSAQRNDLEPPAIEIAPEIGDCLEMLLAQGALSARMSGSGATCFGLFASQSDAACAADALKLQQPNWWIQQTVLGA